MRPYPEDVLKAIQTGVASHFAPELKSTYAQAQFAFSMLLFTFVQRDFDAMVPDLVEGSAALREMLSEVSRALDGVEGDAALAARSALASLPGPAASLHLSALRAESEALRAVVVALTPVIEPAADVAELAPLRPVRERLYAWFQADARRRIFPILSA